VRWLRVKAVPVLNERGEFIRRAGFTEDITERKLLEEELRKYREHLEELTEGRAAELQKEIEEHKRTEEKLKRSERRYALAQRAANIGSWERNLTDDPLFWSEQFEPIFGFNRGEFQGTREAFLECVYPEDRPKLLEASRALVEKGQHYDIEHRIIWPDGSIHWVAELGDVVRDANGKASRIIGIVQDITDRKRIEEALAEERNLLRTLIDNLPDHVYVKDIEGRFLLANKAVAQTIGVITPDELIGKTDFDFSYPQELAEQYYVNEQRVIESGQPLFNQEEPNFNRESGAPIWFLTTLIPFLDSQGNPVGIVGIARDITERKRMEEELRQAKEVAEAANRSKSEFLANMSHEFRTPLTGILGYAHILKGDPGLTEKQHDGLEIIQRSGDHLLTLINDILDLSKIEAGKLELEPEPFNLTKSLKSLVEMTQLRAKQKGFAFIYEEEPELPHSVYGDEKRLRQILLNLLGNAIKFTEQGRVSFRVYELHELHELNEFYELSDLDNSQTPQLPNSSTPKLLNSQTPKLINSQTHQLLNSQTHKLRFQVEDTGIGIPSEQLERIFSPFEQVKDRRLYSEGTGLGLAISRRLVRLMNSELHVKSTVGQGSTFWFDLELPVVKDVIESDVKQSRRIIGFKGKYTLLIVDDKKANRDVLKEMLLLVGFDVIEAADGQEAIDKAIEFHPDLILMDQVMPEMDGSETTRRIRQIPELKDVIVIAVSANVFEQTREKSVEAGCHDFVAKPVSKQILFNRLRSHLKFDWIYESEGDRDYSESGAHPPSANFPEPIIPPPIQTLLRLNELALIGDIMEIHKVIQELEALDRKFNPFVAEVRTLAKALKISEIQRFIKQYIEEKQ
jgi:PAS domain S-box-containing protein